MGFWTWLVGEDPQETDGGARSRGGESAPGRQTPGSPAVATIEPLDPNASRETEDESPPWWAPDGAALLEPPPIERPDLSVEARALENLLVSHFDGHDLNMPPLLHAAERVLPRLSDPKCDLAKIAQIIAEDQVIAAAVLRMANSPLYGGLHKMTALRPALARLGIRALRTLLMHQSLRAATFHSAGNANQLAQLLWRSSLAGACVMRELSRLTGINEEDGSLIGLLHDIGSVVVLRIVLNQEKFMHYEIEVDTFDYLCFECHQEFGELIAEQWKLPSTLKQLICDHHVYPAPDDPLRVQRLQLQLADMIGAMLGYAPPQSFNLLECRAVKDLGLAHRQDFRAMLDELPGRITETLSSL